MFPQPLHYLCCFSLRAGTLAACLVLALVDLGSLAHMAYAQPAATVGRVSIFLYRGASSVVFLGCFVGICKVLFAPSRLTCSDGTGWCTGSRATCSCTPSSRPGWPLWIWRRAPCCSDRYALLAAITVVRGPGHLLAGGHCPAPPAGARLLLRQPLRPAAARQAGDSVAYHVMDESRLKSAC